VFAEDYGWSEGIIGLSYLGAGIGFIVGLILVGATNDRMVNHLTKKYGVRKPEYRMRVMMFFTPLVAIGMFWYGWSAEEKTHWIVPILGTVPIGIGMIGFFVSLCAGKTLILSSHLLFMLSRPSGFMLPARLLHCKLEI